MKKYLEVDVDEEGDFSNPFYDCLLYHESPKAPLLTAEQIPRPASSGLTELEARNLTAPDTIFGIDTLNFGHYVSRDKVVQLLMRHSRPSDWVSVKQKIEKRRDEWVELEVPACVIELEWVLDLLPEGGRA